ncbi:MAG: hypothetical protein WCH35_10375 [Comamonadaceae bacterium]
MQSYLKVPPLLWIMLVAVAGRAWLLFSTPYMPGVNGAYYLIQARAILERGVLGIPDLPLTFYLQAGLSWLLARAGGTVMTDAIMVAVKTCDAVLPVLVAWPVFVLVRRWAIARGQGDAVPLAAAALACLSMPWFMVVGELQKNSLAMVWFALLVTNLHGWLLQPTRRRALALVAVLLLLGLTHIGVLGASVVVTAATALAFLLRQSQGVRWKLILPMMGVGVLILLATSALVVWKFDPSRIQRLGSAFTDPFQFSWEGRQQPGQGRMWLNPDGLLPFLGFAIAIAPSLIVVWYRRIQLEAADFAVVTGCALTVLMMTGPWFSPDKSMRFYLIALLPAIWVVSFGLTHMDRNAWRQSVLGVIVLTGLGGSAWILIPGGKPILEEATMVELENLAWHIQDRDHTLVVADHGVEWWSAWFLHTHIAQPQALSPNVWGRYKTVLFLKVKTGVVSLSGRGGSRPSRISGAPPGHPMPLPGIAEDSELIYDGATLRLEKFHHATQFASARVSPP